MIGSILPEQKVTSAHHMPLSLCSARRGQLQNINVTANTQSEILFLDAAGILFRPAVMGKTEKRRC